MEKVEHKFEQEELRKIIEKHVRATNSKKGLKVLTHFEEYLPKFKKIIPADYKELMMATANFEEQGLSKEDAQIEAFYTCVGGKKA